MDKNIILYLLIYYIVYTLLYIEKIKWASRRLRSWGRG